MTSHQMLTGRVFLAIAISSATGNASASWFDFGWHDLGGAFIGMSSATQAPSLENSAASLPRDSQPEKSTQALRQKCCETNAGAESSEAQPNDSMRHQRQLVPDMPSGDEQRPSDNHHHR